MTIEPEPLSSQSSPTTGGSSTVRYDSYVPRFGEHQEWNVMYENEDWPIFDAARKAVDIKAKHFNESFAEANHLRHMLYGHRDIDQIMDLVKKMLVRVTRTKDWYMFRIRYLLQCNLRIQRFFRKMLESHNIRLDNMFRFWKAAEVEKMQQLQLTAVRSLGAVEQERGRPNWRTEYREFCVIDDVKRHVIHELYWERRQTWRRKRIKWQQQVNALRREEERLVERLRGMEMTPAEEDTSRKRLYEVEWEIHDLMIRAPVFEFARDGAKIDDLRQSAKAVIASGSWSPRPAIGATTPEPVSGGLPKQEAHVEHAEGQSKEFVDPDDITSGSTDMYAPKQSHEGMWLKSAPGPRARPCTAGPSHQPLRRDAARPDGGAPQKKGREPAFRHLSSLRRRSSHSLGLVPAPAPAPAKGRRTTPDLCHSSWLADHGLVVETVGPSSSLDSFVRQRTAEPIPRQHTLTPEPVPRQPRQCARSPDPLVLKASQPLLVRSRSPTRTTRNRRLSGARPGGDSPGGLAGLAVDPSHMPDPLPPPTPSTSPEPPRISAGLRATLRRSSVHRPKNLLRSLDSVALSSVESLVSRSLA